MDVARRTAVCERAGEDFVLTFLDGFDAAIVGLVEQYGMPQPVVLYDKEKILEVLIASGLTPEQAEEYFDHNISCLWVGEETPAFAFLT